MTILNEHDGGATIELAEQDSPIAVYLDEWDRDHVLLTIDDSAGRGNGSVVHIETLAEAIEHFRVRAAMNLGRTV